MPVLLAQLLMNMNTALDNDEFHLLGNKHWSVRRLNVYTVRYSNNRCWLVLDTPILDSFKMYGGDILQPVGWLSLLYTRRRVLNRRVLNTKNVDKDKGHKRFLIPTGYAEL
ncbi:hypothetical protein BaRGS_00003372 [Batillaria attramentaria]|uniref:Uncharacterized protein n=1 Tax=Batillaria attramentaria TaxID=370345 RepID=A0ABD0M0A3_9CAEN